MTMTNLIKKNKFLILVSSIYLILFILMPGKASEAIGSSLYYLIEMFEILPVIFLFTVVIETLVPQKMITKHFGEKSGFRGNLFSLILGSISAGPIYAAFPICRMLISKGASVTNIVIVLSSWAVIKLPMLANEAKFLGVDFMVARWLLTVAAIFGMAYITAIFVKTEDFPVKKLKFEEKELVINENYCIGCGVCAKLVPEYYEMKDNKAIVKKTADLQQDMDLLRKSIKKCPTKAISSNRLEA